MPDGPDNPLYPNPTQDCPSVTLDMEQPQVSMSYLPAKKNPKKRRKSPIPLKIEMQVQIVCFQSTVHYCTIILTAKKMHKKHW